MQRVSVSLATSNIRVQSSMVQNTHFFRNWGKYKLKHGELLMEPYIILYSTHWLRIIKTKFQQLGAYINDSYLQTHKRLNFFNHRLKSHMSLNLIIAQDIRTSLQSRKSYGKCCQ